jgi:hypothetical protein
MAKAPSAADIDLRSYSFDRRSMPARDREGASVAAWSSAWVFGFAPRSSRYRLAGHTDPAGVPRPSMSEMIVAAALITGSLKY